MARDTDRFMVALKLGQRRLADGVTDMDVVSGVLRRFGLALGEFSRGLVGVACVTREGHKAIDAEFVPGVPLSIVIISHEAPDRPMPIVGGLLVAESGFPVEVTIGARAVAVHDEDGFESAMGALAASGLFSSAVADILSSEQRPRKLQS